MKLASIILATSAFVCSTFAFATGDSLRYLNPTDTVMLEITPNLTKFTTHTFAPKQTIYSLSRFYAQDIDQLIELNPELAQKAPVIGHTVKVAVPNVAITRFRTSGFRQNEFAPICYRVRQGETMYKIAKTIFRMPVDTLMSLNGLSTFDLKPGQVLQVGWISVNGAADKIRPRTIDPLQRESYGNYKSYETQSEKVEKRRSVASWTPGTGEASGKLYALVKGVKPGTYLKVTNSANNKFAFVKVIGSPPENTRQDKVDLVLSGTAARLLGAIERNFYVIVE